MSKVETKVVDDSKPKKVDDWSVFIPLIIFVVIGLFLNSFFGYLEKISKNIEDLRIESTTNIDTPPAIITIESKGTPLVGICEKPIHTKIAFPREHKEYEACMTTKIGAAQAYCGNLGFDKALTVSDDVSLPELEGDGKFKINGAVVCHKF